MQISFNNLEELKLHGAPFLVKSLDTNDLRVAELEEIL